MKMATLELFAIFMAFYMFGFWGGLAFLVAEFAFALIAES
jgi:hypothetical protein